MSVTVDSQPEWADNGQAAIYLVVDNISNSLCSIDGYPGVAALDSADHVINVSYEHGSLGAGPIPDPGIYRTPVIPGELAYAGLTWTTGHGAGCSDVSHFQVSLPSPDPMSMTVPFSTSICMVGANPGPLAVTAVGPGESFTNNPYHP